MVTSSVATRRGARLSQPGVACWRLLALVVMILALEACGGGGSPSATSGGGSGSNPGGTTPGTGGGGGSNPGGSTPSENASLSVSPLGATVTATTSDSGLGANFQASIDNLAAGQVVYLSTRATGSIVASQSVGSGSYPVTISVVLKPPASLGVGVYAASIEVQACYDQACQHQITNSPTSIAIEYDVVDGPTKITTLSPSSVLAVSPAFTLTVTGSNFTSQSQVQWNGAALSTSFVSATQLNAYVPATELTSPGIEAVTVTDPNNGPSTPLSFTVEQPALSLTSISPTSVTVGGSPFMLTVLGTGFTTTSTVYWNGSPLPTGFISTGELWAQISAADIAALGTVSIAVRDPHSSIGTTVAQTLTIEPQSIDAADFLINPAHTGSVEFSSVSFPASAAWTTDVGGTPSYALIASGKVILTVTLTGGSALVALEQGSGAVAWGPIAVAGAANATYDSGKVFVLSSSVGSGGALEAFDIDTGQQVWSTPLPPGSDFNAAPTAEDGFVFATDEYNGSFLALNQKDGTVAWLRHPGFGGVSTPAVTADGVYAAYACATFDLRPSTGQIV